MKIFKHALALITLALSTQAYAENNEQIINRSSISPIHSTNFGINQSEIEEIKRAKVLVWQGHCSVHTRFTVDQVEIAKNEKHAKVIVHPECTNEVVKNSDYTGSTEYIIDVVNNSDPGSVWGIGTEINLVKRLSLENPDKDIFCLDPIVCPCATMYRIHPAYLLWVLDGIAAGLVINQVEVDFETKVNSKIALDRMLEL